MATDKDDQEVARQVAAKIALIKASMPKTYQAIQDRAQDLGNAAFALVRRGLKGEACCFYAMERGHVVGTPFTGHAIEPVLAAQMVQFGCEFLVIFPPKEDAHGTH